MWKNLVNKDLYDYIITKIFKQYELNGKAHGIEHIKTVLKRALEIFEQYEDINKNILFTAVVFHDIGEHIDRKNHEIVSAQMMMNDEFINGFFDDKQKEIIKQAIEDHRSSKGKTPRNIYGKINGRY